MGKIVKKVGGDRLGSGEKMTVTAHGYGYSTHDVSRTWKSSMSFGTIVPCFQWFMPSGSRLRINLDALITSNALLYQLYGSAKFQVDVFTSRVANYNPRMQLNLNDQGYNIKDIKFPTMTLETKAFTGSGYISNQQVNPSSLLRYTGLAANGQNFENPTQPVTRKWNAMWLIMYYQLVKEYYANKQEKTGVMIHNGTGQNTSITSVITLTIGEPDQIWKSIAAGPPEVIVTLIPNGPSGLQNDTVIRYTGSHPTPDQITFRHETDDVMYTLGEIYNEVVLDRDNNLIRGYDLRAEYANSQWSGYTFTSTPITDEVVLVEYDLKAIDRMMMEILKSVDGAPVNITAATELPFGASFQKSDDSVHRAVNQSQEGLCVGTYMSDMNNNWLDNATINTLNNKSKVKVDSNGEFTIDQLNITQKLYNYDMRIGITDGTLDEWRELTYGQKSKSRSLKPVFEGGLVKEIVFDMVVSTASTEDDPLASIASRGNFGNKHKGGKIMIDTDEEKLVMITIKITPRLVYNQGNDFTLNMFTLDDVHKPAFDKIGYQNRLSDQVAAFETQVKADGSLVTFSIGKQPAFQDWRSNLDVALGNMADSEDYKVFGRTYSAEKVGGYYKIKDMTTYIDPTIFNDVFAIQSLDAMNFDVQVGVEAWFTAIMSEEVIPGV